MSIRITAPRSLSTMWEFGNGQAYFQHVSPFKTPTSTPVYRSETFNIDGAITADVGNTWYMFHRELYDVAGATACPGEPFRVRIVVRTSTNKGVSWSSGTPILDPSAPFCQLVDGDVYYDADNGDMWNQLSPSGVFDEGTPDIVDKNSDGSFNVTFHGVDLASVTRGCSETRTTLFT